MDIVQEASEESFPASDSPSWSSGGPVEDQLVLDKRIAEKGEVVMKKCEVCGNEYGNAFTVVFEGKSHTFDSFECAIHSLAPRCAHCGCMVIGHGVEREGDIFCCAHCERSIGTTR